MSAPSVEVTRPAPGVIQVQLCRPEVMNALNHGMVRELRAVLDRVDLDETCHAVVLTGAGRGFCAGLDLGGYRDDDLVETQGRLRRTYTRQVEIADLVRRIRSLRQPVIAAVNGPAAGGGFALALAADVRLAAGSAVFAASFIRVGYSGCDIGTSWLLPRLVGTGRAHELMLTGRRVDADEALRLGIVTDIVGGEELVGTALAKAAEILRNPPLSVELTKQGMWTAVELPTLDMAIALENRQQVMTAFTEDQGEAARAFLGRRDPTYTYR